jgi:hypothetical protein
MMSSEQLDALDAAASTKRSSENVSGRGWWYCNDSEVIGDEPAGWRGSRPAPERRSATLPPAASGHVCRRQWRDAGCYIVAQVLGGALGASALLTWGSIGASAAWGATVPGAAIPLIYAVCGEVICTFAMVSFVFLFASKPSTQPYTPLVNPPLFAILSWLEASVSGASANPVRSLAPELVGWAWSGWWIYWTGPALGAALAVGVFRYGLAGRYRPHQARMCHFGHPGGTLHP